MKKEIMLPALAILAVAFAAAAIGLDAAVAPPPETTGGHDAARYELLKKRLGKGEKGEALREPISGKALEVIDSAGYSYVLVQRPNGEKVWVAVTESPVQVGSEVSFRPGVVMKNFRSKGLNRSFESVVFSDGAATPAGAQKAGAAAGRKATAVQEKISVPKATGHNAVTVAEAFDRSSQLDKKSVVVRGKVVKVSSRIMKRNWIHIQDGTGSRKKGNDNLVCTSKETAEVGEVVTVRGTLAKDRDFGSGYRYRAIVENARIER